MPYISRVSFFANWDFKTFSRVVKFAFEEESNGRRIHLFARALCTVQSVLLVLHTQVAFPGSHSCISIGSKFFACC